MVRLGDILSKMNEIEARTLRSPTHVVVSKRVSEELVNQYNEIANSDADSVYQFGEKKYTSHDVEGFLGVQLVISLQNKDEFKILEEITPDS